MTTPSLTVRVRRIDPAASLPRYAHHGDAGADLVCTRDVTLRPGERALVPTGLAVEIPDGYVGLVHPRSGLAQRSGLGMVNGPGTIDSGYRGEIKLILINHDPAEDVVLARGDRVAQLLIQRVERARFVEVPELADTDRGADGYGSTGGSAILGDVCPPTGLDGLVDGSRGETP